jgi:hypothetical protein
MRLQLDVWCPEDIQEIVDILTPFADATNMLQGEKTTTVSLIIPCIEELKSTLHEMCEKLSNTLVAALRDSVNQRLDMYLTITKNQFATVLDPRFKATYADADTVQKILAHVKKYETATESSAVHGESTLVEPPAKKPRMFKRCAQPVQTHRSPGMLEWEAYKDEALLDEDSDALAYWSRNQAKYPMLSAMAAEFLVSPATSAPVERLFSIAGKVFTKERSRLKDVSFMNLMMIRCNQHLL